MKLKNDEKSTLCGILREARWLFLPKKLFYRIIASWFVSFRKIPNSAFTNALKVAVLSGI